MLRLNLWIVLMLFILLWHNSESIKIIDKTKDFFKKEPKNIPKYLEEPCETIYNESSTSNTDKKVFFRKNEYCFFFTLTQTNHKPHPCGFANFSSLLYLKNPSEDPFLEEFINKTVEKLKLTNSGAKRFDFRLGLDYDLANSKLMWIDENNNLTEVSKNVTAYLNTKNVKKPDDDEFIVVRFSTNDGLSIRNDAKNDYYYYGCRFFCERCIEKESNNETNPRNISCNFFYSGNECEKWSTQGVITIGFATFIGLTCLLGIAKQCYVKKHEKNNRFSKIMSVEMNNTNKDIFY